MNQNKVILYGSIAIIIILLMFNVRIYYLENEFDKYCIKQYNLDDPCPCNSIKQLNLTQESLYTQNLNLSLHNDG